MEQLSGTGTEMLGPLPASLENGLQHVLGPHCVELARDFTGGVLTWNHISQSSEARSVLLVLQALPPLEGSPCHLPRGSLSLALGTSGDSVRVRCCPRRARSDLGPCSLPSGPQCLLSASSCKGKAGEYWSSGISHRSHHVHRLMSGQELGQAPGFKEGGEDCSNIIIRMSAIVGA